MLNPLVIVFIGCGLIYFAVCLLSFVGLFVPLKKREGEQPTVSVIVPARNEEASIGLLLDDLLAQSYPADRYDITVVDDCSTDLTVSVVQRYLASHPNLSLASSDRSSSPYSHKKKAVHEGILSSNGEIIMTVDADCRVKKDWIENMTAYFRDGVDLVAGEVSIGRGGFIGMLETLEFTGIQLMSAGS